MVTHITSTATAKWSLILLPLLFGLQASLSKSCELDSPLQCHSGDHCFHQIGQLTHMPVISFLSACGERTSLRTCHFSMRESYAARLKNRQAYPLLCPLISALQQWLCQDRKPIRLLRGSPLNTSKATK